MQKTVVDALLVLVLTPHIRAYLETNDPKALEQAATALADAGVVDGSTGEVFSL